VAYKREKEMKKDLIAVFSIEWNEFNNNLINHDYGHDCDYALFQNLRFFVEQNL
jgi:hypothetical protein